MLVFVHPQGDTLAIDGSGWVFQLLEGQRVDHGGDYDLLHEAVVLEVSRLRQVRTSTIRVGKGGGARLRICFGGRGGYLLWCQEQCRII